MSKKVFIFLFVFVLCLSFTASSYEREGDPDLQVNTSPNTNAQFEENSAKAVGAHEKLLSFFKEHNPAKPDSAQEFVYTIDGIPAEAYPEYYAGDYLNRSGKLVILLTEEYSGNQPENKEKADAVKAEIQEITGVDDIIYGYTKYSFCELGNVKKTIYEFVTSEKENKFNITGSGLDVVNNCVNVYVYPLNSEAENWFRENVIDHLGLVFFERHPDAIQATDSAAVEDAPQKGEKIYIDYLIGDIVMCIFAYIIAKKLPTRFLNYNQKWIFYIIAIRTFQPFEELGYSALEIIFAELIYKLCISGTIIWIAIAAYAKMQALLSKKRIIDSLQLDCNDIKVKAHFTIRSCFMGKLIKTEDLRIKKGFKLQIYELPDNVSISEKHISCFKGEPCIAAFMGQLISITPA